MINFLKDTKISIKLTTITVVSIALMSALAGWAIYSLNLNRWGLDHVVKAIHRTSIATEAQIGTKEVGVTARNIFMADTKEKANEAAKKTLRYLVLVDERLQYLRNKQNNTQHITAIDAIRQLWDTYSQLTKTSTDAALKALSQRTVFFSLGPPLTKVMNDLVTDIESIGDNNILVGSHLELSVIALVKLANFAEAALHRRRIAIWRYLAIQDRNQIADFYKEITIFDDTMADLKQQNLTNDLRTRVAFIQQASAEYNQVGSEVIRLQEISNDLYFNKATHIRSEAGDLIDGLVKDIITEENHLIDQMIETSIFTSQWLLVVVAIATILLLIVTTLIGRTITQPIVSLIAMIEQLAEGHLDITIDGAERGDEIGLMARSITRMVSTLGQLLRELQNLIKSTKAGEIIISENATQLKGEYAGVVVGAKELLEVLTKPLIEVVEVVQHLASGNLRKRMQGTYEGDLHVLKSSVNRSLDDLLSLLKTCLRAQELRSRSSSLRLALHTTESQLKPSLLQESVPVLCDVIATDQGKNK